MCEMNSINNLTEECARFLAQFYKSSRDAQTRTHKNGQKIIIYQLRPKKTVCLIQIKVK